MPHFDETSPEDSEHSEDLSLSMNHPPAATSDYGIAVNRTSTTRDGRLVLLSRNGTPHVGSEHKPNVASYIADKDGEWHPWVKVSRGDEVDEDDEPETVQMCLTVNEPSNMETGVVDADPPLSAQDGEVYGQRV